MIDFETARQLAMDYIYSHDEFQLKDVPGDRLVLEHASEFDTGWIFYFNSKQFLETHDVKDRPLGIGTIIVGKESGEIYEVEAGGNEARMIRKFKER